MVFTGRSQTKSDTVTESHDIVIIQPMNSQPQELGVGKCKQYIGSNVDDTPPRVIATLTSTKTLCPF